MSIDRQIVIKREKESLAKFFNQQIISLPGSTTEVVLPGLPDLPNWIDDEIIRYWHENLFDVHYLPLVSLDENFISPIWRDKPSKTFYKKIREGKLKEEAKNLLGKWILIDNRDKPSKKVPWVTINDVWILRKMGFNPKNYFKKWGKQLHDNEYLTEILKKKEFGSRFCLTIYEINDLKPFVLNFLKIESQKVIRLPFFIEYNYLGNVFYKQWATTETWEWFEDKFDNGQNLAGGSKSVGCLGWEPPEFWSTILTFRPVVEL